MQSLCGTDLFVEQLTDNVRRLCTDPEPILCALDIDVDLLFSSFDRHIRTDFFDRPAVARRTLIHDNDAIIRTFLRAELFQSDFDHCNPP